MEENQHISSLFQRIRLRLGKQLLDRETLIRIIFSETKLQIPEANIQYKKRILLLNVSSLARNEIYLKKEVILRRIKEETGLEVKDLR